MVGLRVKRTTSMLMALALTLAACGGATVADHSPDAEDAVTTTVGGGAPDPAVPSTRDEPEIPERLAPMSRVWRTDWSKATIDLEELLVGIPASDPRDMIPPIDRPVFERVTESDWIGDSEPGVLVEIDDDARFYPLSILTRHEIVNDEFGDLPVAVTYCPLCNTALVFDRRFEGEVLRLGVSGLLRNSDLVMWDDLTHSLWQQITGEAIVGELAGESLAHVASAIVRWEDFRSDHPEGSVLARNQGFGNSYGLNPYQFYSSRERPYGFFTGEIDARFPALERVVGVSLETASKAYPFSVISEARVVNDVVGDQAVVVFWGAADTADALDSGVIADARGVGTGVAYSPVVDGAVLTFEAIGDTEFIDLETGTTWTILGKAVAGPLEGAELELVPHRNEFWFAWQAFFPEAEVFEG